MSLKSREKSTVILVADDDRDVCDALKFALELENYTVNTCNSGIDLLNHGNLARAGCIVLDLKMPDLNGFDVLSVLTSRGLDVPVILITSPVTDSIVSRANAAGIAHVLEKPLLDTALMDRVREILT